MNLPKQGQIIHCTRCQKPLLKFVRDVIPEDIRLDRSLFEPIGEQKIGQPGESATCSYCDKEIDPKNYR